MAGQEGCKQDDASNTDSGRGTIRAHLRAARQRNAMTRPRAEVVKEVIVGDRPVRETLRAADRVLDCV